MKEFFFHILVSLHPASSLRIKFFTDNFQEFLLNEYLPMAISSYCTICLKSTCETVSVFARWYPETCTWNKQFVQRCSIAKVLWKVFQNSEVKQEALIRRCSVKKKMLLKILQNLQENTCAGHPFKQSWRLEGLQHY